MQYQRIMSLPPMFPQHARKTASSLYDLSAAATTAMITKFIRSLGAEQPKAVGKVRRHLRKQLPAATLTHLIQGLIPGQDAAAKWEFPCVEAEERLHCRIHWQCDLVHSRLPEIIRVLFSEDISGLRLSLKRVRIDHYPAVLDSLSWVITKEPARQFPNLTSLALAGGTVHSDCLAPRIEHLCALLASSAANLQHLHLPVGTNLVLLSASTMARLRALRADRTIGFNRVGLQHLSSPGAASSTGLEVLVLGVYRHANFEKQDVAAFIRAMPGLKEFSLLDSDRALVRLTGQQSPGDKVLVYSAFKRAILDSELPGPDSEGPAVKRRHGPGGGLRTGFTSIGAVDRSLKPHYLLESAPRLTRLQLDWQQELALPPFRRFQQDWFPQMLRGRSWAELSSRLTRLDITFPAAYSPNSYCLPLEDYTRLMQRLPQLQELRLVGAGGGGPLPLIPTLAYCPCLRDLVLEGSPVHVPDNYEVISQSHVSKTLTRFYYLGEMSSLLVHDFMMRGIAAYMPALEELEVQPQTVLGYGGLRPDQVRELACLPRLKRLSVPLSVRECISNLPQVIFVLREFQALRHLTFSWGLWCDSYDVSRGKIAFMMSWLLNALQAENAAIDLQLCYKQHPQEFAHPSNPSGKGFL